MLIGISGCLGFVNGTTIGFGPVLADLELAFNARDGDAEADDTGQHGAAIAVGKIAPLVGIGRIVGLDEPCKEGFFGGIIFNEFKRAIGVYGDVVPGGDGELLGVERWADVGVRAGKDNQGFAIGERLPMGIGLGEVAFEKAVRTFFFYDEGKMRGVVLRSAYVRVERSEEDREGVAAHGFDEDCAVGDLIEFGCVHSFPGYGTDGGYLYQVNGPATMLQRSALQSGQRSGQSTDGNLWSDWKRQTGRMGMEADRATAEVVDTSRARRRGIGPAVALFFTAPLVAEFLLGNLPIKLLPALIVLAPMYGGGALLIREVVRRMGRGWPSILVLGMAYAIVEEAYTTQSLFNPNYLKLNLGLLAPAYIPSLGIGAWWTLWMLMVHGIWSISTPIALIEACVPDRARTPWLGRAGLTVVVIVFLFGGTATTLMGYRQDHFLATKAQFVWAAVAIAVLVALALRMPALRKYPADRDAPPAWLLGIVALAFASAALLVPMQWGWMAVAVLLALDAVMLTIVLIWARMGAMTLAHQLALGAGAALAYGWHAFLQHPAVGGAGSSVRVGNAVFLAAAVGLIWFAARRVRSFES